MTAAYVVLALVGGVAGTLQVAVMGRLGERVGTVEALAFSALTMTVVTVIVLLAARRSVEGYGTVLRQPVWLWTGGVLGALIVFTITLVSPRLGTFATVGIFLAGQLAMGVVVDRFGMFGFDKIPLTWSRVSGVALLALGAGLALKK